MTRIVPAIALMLLPSAALAASPQSKTWGLGVGGGTWVNGFSIKHMNGDSTAIQGVVGAFGNRHGGNGIAGSASFLFEQPTFTTTEALDLAWNFGFGADGAIWDERIDQTGLNSVSVGAHGVLGLEILIVPVPIDLVLEYRPGVIVVPDVGLDLVNFGAHLRWWL